MIVGLDLVVRLVAMAAVFAVAFAAPGWVLAARLEPDAGPSRRWALALVVGPTVVGVTAWTVGGALGWFLDPMLVGVCGIGVALSSPRVLRDLRGELRRLRNFAYGRTESLGAGFPAALAVAVVGYFLLKFDSMYFHTLGANAGVMHAVGHPLGTETLTANAALAGAFPQTEGQTAPAAAFAAAFGYPGLRLWFAGTMLGLGLIAFQLAARVGLGRRASVVAATLAAFNPYTMYMNQVDGLENLLPALWLGTFALLAAGPRPGAETRPLSLGLVAGILAATRHVFFLGVPIVAAVLWRRSGPRAAGRVLVGALPALAWVLLQHHLGDRPLLFDEGLHPLAADTPGSWWWTGPLSMLRMPYAAFPPWLLLPVALIGTLGTLLVTFAAVGGRSLRRSPATRLTFALLAPATAFVLFHGAVLQGKQMARPAVLVVLLAVAAVLGASRGLAAFRGGDRRALLGPIVAAVALLGIVRLLGFVPFPIDARAYASFPHLLPEPEPWAEAERRRTVAVGPLPAYTPDFLIDPLIVGQGKRWRDLGYELGHPDFEDRYISLDEKLLTFHKGDRFTERWLPNHPRRRPEAQPKGAGDPYLEQQPMTVAVDLRAALTQEQMWVDCRRAPRDDTVLDMARLRGPVRLNVTYDPARPPIALHVFKEYYGPSEVEIALVAVPPDWTGSDEKGVNLTLDDGVLRFLVPGAAFFSYAQVLGERDDTMELLVGLEWHAALRCEEGPKVFGPFRL